MGLSKSFKKFTYIFLALAMIISGICIAGNKEVQAAEGLTEAADKTYSYIAYSDLTNYDEKGIPTEDGYLFAGWYKSSDCTTKENALTKDETPGEGHYAKFVKADALNVLAQATLDVVDSTNVNSLKDKYVLRFVSSVDSTDYQNVGFKVSYKVGEKTVTGTFTTKNVYSRIYATTGETYAYSPKVVSTKGDAFITAKLPLDAATSTAERTTATEFKVQAFWDTFDGKRVFGEERYISYDEATNDQVLKMHMTEAWEDNATYGLNIDGEIKTATVTQIDVNNVKITLPEGMSREDLSSVSKLELTKNEEVVETVLYRNLAAGYDPAGTSVADTTWYDNYASGTEFLIATNADLYGLAEIVGGKVSFQGKTIYLATDITMNDGLATGFQAEAALETPTVNNWKPIGRNEADSGTSRFLGTFDGQMCSISGIYCERGTTDEAGLFSQLGAAIGENDDQSKVLNLKIENSYFHTGGSNAGAVAAKNYGGYMDTIYVGSDVTVSGDKSYIGGLVGILGAVSGKTVTIKNCWSAANITASSSAMWIGGLVGCAYGTPCNVSDCLVSGAITSTSVGNIWLGGIVGGNNSAGSNVTINNTLNTGSIMIGTANKGYGSVYGMNNTKGTTCTITDSYCTFEMESNMYKTGTITGDGEYIAAIQLEGSNAEVNLPETFDFEKTWKTVDGSTPILAAFEEEPAIGWYDTSWYGDGTASTFTLYDKEDLYGFAKLAESNQFSGKTIKLGNDIVINTEDATKLSKDKKPTYFWNPIGKNSTTHSVDSGGKFKGIFDGQGHTISGLYSVQDTGYNGLFAWVLDGYVKNLKLSNSYFYTSSSIIGSVAGRLERGSFDSIEVEDTVIIEYESEPARTEPSLEVCAGGWIGYSSAARATLNNCSFAGTININSTKMRDTGGLVGQARGSLTISNCLVTGHIDISASTANLYPRAGGMVGFNSAGSIVIKNSVFRGTCAHGTASSGTKEAEVRAFVGLNNNGALTVEDCYNKENVTRQYQNYGTGTATGLAETIKESNKASLGYENLLKTGYWAVGEDDYPILTTAKQSPTIVPDTTWYKAGETTLYISDREDLYGFAQLAQTNDFSGVTIYLTSDIVINSGESTDWAFWVPAYAWIPIGSNAAGTGTGKDFAGIFDGQGYTISGLYHNRSVAYGGLFRFLAATGHVKDLKIANSYLKAAGEIGAVVGYNRGGDFTNVYVDSDVTVSSTGQRTGGIVGRNNGTTQMDMNMCWNAATVTASNSMIGGLVGHHAAGTLNITNCLNTGVISGGSGPNLGGLLGRVSATTIINQSLHAGTISVPETEDTGYKLYGAIVGYGQSANIITYNDVYATGTPNRFADLYSNNSQTGKDTEVTNIFADASVIYGAEAIDKLKNFDFINTWATVEDSTPILEFGYLTAQTILWKTLAASEETVTGVSDSGTRIAIEGEGAYLPQGGWTGDNGHHYQAFINRMGTHDDDSDNLVCIAEFDKEGTPVSQTALNLPLYHANDVTYNSKEQCLLVCYAGTKLAKIDVNNLAGGITSEVTLSDTIYCIDYDEVNNRYVVGFSNNFKVLDSDFATVGDSHSTEIHSQITCTSTSCADADCTDYDTCQAEGYVKQGVACDERYVYFITYRTCYHNHVLAENNQIAVYDWNGNFVTWIELDNPEFETENISIANGNIYYTVWTQGDSRDEAMIFKFDIAGATSQYKLLDKPVSKYSIVISDQATELQKEMAQYLSDEIYDKTKVSLKVVSHANISTGYNIVISNTISTGYKITQTGNSFAIEYKDSTELIEAFKELVALISEDGTKTATFPITGAATRKVAVAKADGNIRVMSSNVCNQGVSDWANPTNTPNPLPIEKWPLRAQILAETFLTYQPDFIGLQEVSVAQLAMFAELLGSQYAQAEVNFADTTNMTPIFYRKDLYTQIEGGYSVIKENYRYVEWAVYKDADENQIIHMNLHFDPTYPDDGGNAIREENAQLANSILDTLVAENKYPNAAIVITGDYNDTSASAAYNVLTEGLNMASGADIIKNTDSTYYTFHTLGVTSTPPTTYTNKGYDCRGPIDIVTITTDKLEAVKYGVIWDPIVCSASDHYPVLLDVVRK